MPCRAAFRPTSSLTDSGRRTHRSTMCAHSARAGQLRMLRGHRNFCARTQTRLGHVTGDSVTSPSIPLVVTPF